MSTIQPKIKIFLASSFELKHEREQIEIAVNRLNGLWHGIGFFLDLQIWEDASIVGKSFRSQDNYNHHVKDCQIFFLLFFSRVGRYSLEEFKIAKNRFDETGIPRIVIFQKNTPIPQTQSESDSQSRFSFLNSLRDAEYFPVPFESTAELLREIERSLNALLDEGYISRVSSSSILGNVISLSKNGHLESLDYQKRIPKIPYEWVALGIILLSLLQILLPFWQGNHWSGVAIALIGCATGCYIFDSQSKLKIAKLKYQNRL